MRRKRKRRGGITYLYDGNGYIRQTVNEHATPTYAWTFSTEGAVLLGEQGPVTHLSCNGDAVYDWSTGLIYKNGNYFDPQTGIWLTVGVVVASGSHQRRKGRGKRKGKEPTTYLWLALLLLLLFLLAGCGGPTPTPIGNYACPTPTATELPLPTVTPTLPSPIVIVPPTQQPPKPPTPHPTVTPPIPTPTETQEPRLPNGQRELSFPLPSFRFTPPLASSYKIENQFGSSKGRQNDLGGHQGSGHDGLDLIAIGAIPPVPVYAPVNGKIWDYEASSFTITIRDIKDASGNVIAGLEVKVTHVYQHYDIDQDGILNQLFSVWDKTVYDPNEPLSYYDNIGYTGGIAHLHLGIAMYDNVDYTGNKTYYNPERLLP